MFFESVDWDAYENKCGMCGSRTTFSENWMLYDRTGLDGVGECTMIVTKWFRKWAAVSAPW